MLIGLNGRKQAGKDTVYARACHIMRDVVTVERASFADLLYASAAASLGVTVAQLQVWKADPCTVVRVQYAGADECFHAELTIREYLQRYGTEAHRDVFGPDFWVEQVRRTLSNHEGRIVMVTDVRFPNEAEAVRACGGAVAQVIGPDAIENTGDGHASEAPLPEYLIDAFIKNKVRDDNYRTLDGQVDTLLRLVLNGSLPC
jgi:hypothetical protein